MRNPFPKIGKVIKYDFKHSSRRLLPLYGALLVLGLLVGLFAEPSRVFHDEAVLRNQFFVAGLFFAFMVLSVVSVVMTVVSIAKGFKQSMLEDEAYLNLSLPVTIGEHLWGKFIMAFGWLFCCCIIVFLSGLMCFIRAGWDNIFNEIAQNLPEMQASLEFYGLSFGKVIAMAILLSVAFAFFVITLIFVVNAISHLFKKSKGFVKFVTVVVLFWINGWIYKLVPEVDSNSFSVMQQVGPAVIKSMCISMLISLLISAVYFALTQYIFTKKLNLE